MITTVQEVFELTGYSANAEDVKRAQAIVEVFAGRPEAMISRDDDLAWMRYAVAWQVAYMETDPKAIYEQSNVQSVSSNDTVINFGDKAYQMAPLAQKAVSRLSWQRSRSIATGAAYPRLDELEGWEYA